MRPDMSIVLLDCAMQPLAQFGALLPPPLLREVCNHLQCIQQSQQPVFSLCAPKSSVRQFCTVRVPLQSMWLVAVYELSERTVDRNAMEIVLIVTALAQALHAEIELLDADFVRLNAAEMALFVSELLEEQPRSVKSQWKRTAALIQRDEVLYLPSAMYYFGAGIKFRRQEVFVDVVESVSAQSRITLAAADDQQQSHSERVLSSSVDLCIQMRTFVDSQHTFCAVPSPQLRCVLAARQFADEQHCAEACLIQSEGRYEQALQLYEPDGGQSAHSVARSQGVPALNWRKLYRRRLKVEDMSPDNWKRRCAMLTMRCQLTLDGWSWKRNMLVQRACEDDYTRSVHVKSYPCQLRTLPLSIQCQRFKDSTVITLSLRPHFSRYCQCQFQPCLFLLF
eukprot:TRINITY_DN2614_c0_g1_i1.p1 TRINITY_DN2614_c0_g1~~TRINITY_DN2614_c0_g1_i1.p1  ORF type:complete len:394 (-),score=63.62 TRINITY_DN2614_c0_g1_i1:1006-2187(-)